MYIEELIQNNEKKLSDTDKKICQYIIENKGKMNVMSINTLAEETFTSRSSVLRLAQKLGFSGFSEFKYLVEWGKEEGESTFVSIEGAADKVKQLLNGMSMESCEGVFELIKSSRNIYLLSTGQSQRIQAEALQRNFLNLGIGMNMLPSSRHTHLNTSITEKLSCDDLLIVFTYSGENELIKDTLSIPLLKNVPITSFTGVEGSWLEKHSTYCLSLKLDKETSSIRFFTAGYMHMLIDYLTFLYGQYVKEQISKTIKE